MLFMRRGVKVNVLDSILSSSKDGGTFSVMVRRFLLKIKTFHNGTWVARTGRAIVAYNAQDASEQMAADTKQRMNYCMAVQ